MAPALRPVEARTGFRFPSSVFRTRPTARVPTPATPPLPHLAMKTHTHAYTEALRDVHEAASDGGMRFDQTTPTDARAHTGGATL